MTFPWKDMHQKTRITLRNFFRLLCTVFNVYNDAELSIVVVIQPKICLAILYIFLLHEMSGLWVLMHDRACVIYLVLFPLFLQGKLLERSQYCIQVGEGLFCTSCGTICGKDLPFPDTDDGVQSSLIISIIRVHHDIRRQLSDYGLSRKL